MDNEIEGFTKEGEEREIREPRPFPKIERTPGKRDVTDFDIVKEKLKTKITKKIKKKAKISKISKALQKAIAKREKEKKQAILQSRIARQKLLSQLASKKRVNVLARVTDRIPNILVKRRDEEIKPTFLGKGGLL